jgi:hypothetical protein
LQLDAISEEEKAVLNDHFIEMFVDAGLPFRIVENPAVKAFFSRMCSAYKLPTRKYVSGIRA